MSYQEDLILSIYNKGEPGLAMGNIPPGKGGAPGQPYDAPKEDPKNPYVPAPKRDLAGRVGYHTTTNGGFVNQAGMVFYNDNGVLRPDGEYDEKIHGALIPPIGLDQANQSMQINPDVAMFPRLSTGEPMTNIEKKQGIEVLRKTKNPKQIKLFIQQMKKGV